MGREVVLLQRRADEREEGEVAQEEGSSSCKGNEVGRDETGEGGSGRARGEEMQVDPHDKEEEEQGGQGVDGHEGDENEEGSEGKVRL